MATMSDEKKMSIAMKKGMDRLSFEPALVVLDYMRENSNMQMRMMDLIMTFLNAWADNYRAGVTREGQPMHRLGEMAIAMLDAASAPQTGRG